MANEFTARNGLIAQKDSVVTGSLIVTSGITGSLLGTASYAAQALTASYASAYAAVFPYTGSAIISGSLQVTGSVLVSESVRVGLGTTANNAIQFGSADLGMSSTSTNRLDFVTAGVSRVAILSNGTVVMGSDTTNVIGNTFLDFSTNATGIRFTPTTLTLSTGTGTPGTGVNYLRMFQTGNIVLQNGGTFTDAGYRLDVQGSTRLNGTAYVSGSLAVNYPGLASIYKLGVGGSAVINGQIIVQDDSGIFAAYSSDGLTQTGGFNFNRYVGVNIYSSNANPIKFLVSGSELARINTTNVTLGSTNQNLVFTPTAGNPTLIQTGTTSSIAKVQSGTRALQLVSYAADINYLQAEGARLRIVTAGANGISFQTNGVLAGSISSNQNWTLGGEPDVGYRLDVSGSTRLNGNTNITGSAIISGSLEVPQVSGLNTSGGSLVILSTNNATKGTIDIGNNNAESVYLVNRQFQFTNVVLCAASNANGFLITRVTPTDTLPNYVTNRADQTTGIGGTINTLSLITSGSTRLKASSAGNILIGTTTDAGFRLDVQGTSNFTAKMIVSEGVNTFRGTREAFIGVNTDTGSGEFPGIWFNTSTSRTVFNYALLADTTNTIFNAPPTGTLLFRVGNIQKFRVFDNGNIIIQNGGTYTDAGFRLDVSGSTRLNGNTTVSGSIALSGSISLNNGTDLMKISRGSGALGRLVFSRPGNEAVESVTFGGGNEEIYIRSGAGRITHSGPEFQIQNTTGTTGLGLFSTTGDVNLYGNSSTNGLRLFGATRNVLIQNGSTFTDAGYRLDVQGTSRFNGNMQISGSGAFMAMTSNVGDAFAFRSNGPIRLEAQNVGILYGSTTVTGLYARGTGANIILANQTTNFVTMYGNTGNLSIQNGGTYVDSGYKLDVSGSVRIKGSANTSISSSLVVLGSGSAQPIFTVQGSQGELFSVTDSLSGSLFSVNDISGLPVLEAFSDNTVLLGSYQAPALITTYKTVLTASGNFTLSSLPTASYDGAFYDYTARSGSNARAGTIMAMWSGTAVNFTETTTLDFGSTTGLSLGVFVSGANMVLTGSASTSAWTIKTIIRSI